LQNALRDLARVRIRVKVRARVDRVGVIVRFGSEIWKLRMRDLAVAHCAD